MFPYLSTIDPRRFVGSDWSARRRNKSSAPRRIRLPLARLTSRRALFEPLEPRVLLAADFGDAPDADAGAGTAMGDYETLSANGGPSHTIVAELFLGAGVDEDSGLLQNLAANADDVDGAMADDEDGVLSQLDLVGTIGAAPTVTLLATNITGNDAILAGWIDFDHNGAFDNASERATIVVPDGTIDGRFTLTFPAVPDALTSQTYARFRLSTDPTFVADPKSTGAASDGEVEDHRFTITAPGNGTVKFDTIPSNSQSGHQFESVDSGDRMAAAIANLGDLNGDGVIDVAFGSPVDENSDAELGNQRGSVYIALSNLDRPREDAVRITHFEVAGSDPIGNDVFAHFGSALAGLGDLDGDGVGDLAVGAPGESAVFVLMMNSDGTVKSHVKISDGLVGFTPNSLHRGHRFGSSLASIGDLDGDGVSDLVAGADGDESGAVYVLFLNRDGSVKSHVKIATGLAGFSASGLEFGDRFGSSLAGLGDLDGDGVVDLAVGARGDENTESGEGAVYVLFLNADGTVNGHVKISDGLAGFMPEGLDGSEAFGSSVTSVGDLDGDGVADLAVGADQERSSNMPRGAVFVLFLDSDGTVKSNVKVGPGFGGFRDFPVQNLGRSLANMGDLDGDGVTDLAVGISGGGFSGAIYLGFAPLPKITLSVDNTTIEEASGVATFAASLSVASSLTVTVNLGFAGTATVTDDYTISGTEILIPAGETVGTITVSSVQDAINDNDETIVVSVIGVTNGFQASEQQQSITITEDDIPGFTLSKTTATVSEDGIVTDSFIVALDAQPLTDVVIMVMSGDTDEATVDVSSLTFTPSDWDTAQTVTIKGEDDLTVDGNQATTVTLSVDAANSDSAFVQLDDQVVTVITKDDDVAGFTLSKTNAAVSDDGMETDSFTVVLNAQPLTDVVITVISGDTDQVTVDKATLIFSNSSWNLPQTVTLSGVVETVPMVDGEI